MRQSAMTAGLIGSSFVTAGAAIALAMGGNDAPRDARPLPAAETASARPEPSLAEKFDRLEAEFEAAAKAHRAFYRGSTIPEADQAKAAAVQPDFPAVVRRITGLAGSAPRIRPSGMPCFR